MSTNLDGCWSLEWKRPTWILYIGIRRNEDTIVKKANTCGVISEVVNAGLFAITLLYVQWTNFEPVKIWFSKRVLLHYRHLFLASFDHLHSALCNWTTRVSLSKIHRRSQYEANRGTRLGKILMLEDFIRLISYNGPCVRLGCSFFLATALVSCDKYTYFAIVIL